MTTRTSSPLERETRPFSSPMIQDIRLPDAVINLIHTLCPGRDADSALKRRIIHDTLLRLHKDGFRIVDEQGKPTQEVYNIISSFATVRSSTLMEATLSSSGLQMGEIVLATAREIDRAKHAAAYVDKTMREFLYGLAAIIDRGEKLDEQKLRTLAERVGMSPQLINALLREIGNPYNKDGTLAFQVIVEGLVTVMNSYIPETASFDYTDKYRHTAHWLIDTSRVLIQSRRINARNNKPSPMRSVVDELVKHAAYANFLTYVAASHVYRSMEGRFKGIIPGLEQKIPLFRNAFYAMIGGIISEGNKPGGRYAIGDGLERTLLRMADYMTLVYFLFSPKGQEEYVRMCERMVMEACAQNGLSASQELIRQGQEKALQRIKEARIRFFGGRDISQLSPLEQLNLESYSSDPGRFVREAWNIVAQWAVYVEGEGTKPGIVVASNGYYIDQDTQKGAKKGRGFTLQTFVVPVGKERVPYSPPTPQPEEPPVSPPVREEAPFSRWRGVSPIEPRRQQPPVYEQPPRNPPIQIYQRGAGKTETTTTRTGEGVKDVYTYPTKVEVTTTTTTTPFEGIGKYRGTISEPVKGNALTMTDAGLITVEFSNEVQRSYGGTVNITQPPETVTLRGEFPVQPPEQPGPNTPATVVATFPGGALTKDYSGKVDITLPQEIRELTSGNVTITRPDPISPDKQIVEHGTFKVENGMVYITLSNGTRIRPIPKERLGNMRVTLPERQISVEAHGTLQATYPPTTVTEQVPPTTEQHPVVIEQTTRERTEAFPFSLPGATFPLGQTTVTVNGKRMFAVLSVTPTADNVHLRTTTETTTTFREFDQNGNKIWEATEEQISEKKSDISRLTATLSLTLIDPATGMAYRASFNHNPSLSIHDPKGFSVRFDRNGAIVEGNVAKFLRLGIGSDGKIYVMGVRADQLHHIARGPGYAFKNPAFVRNAILMNLGGVVIDALLARQRARSQAERRQQEDLVSDIRRLQTFSNTMLVFTSTEETFVGTAGINFFPLLGRLTYIRTATEKTSREAYQSEHGTIQASALSAYLLWCGFAPEDIQAVFSQKDREVALQFDATGHVTRILTREKGQEEWNVAAISLPHSYRAFGYTYTLAPQGTVVFDTAQMRTISDKGLQKQQQQEFERWKEMVKVFVPNGEEVLKNGGRIRLPDGEYLITRQGKDMRVERIPYVYTPLEGFTMFPHAGRASLSLENERVVRMEIPGENGKNEVRYFSVDVLPDVVASLLSSTRDATPQEIQEAVSKVRNGARFTFEIGPTPEGTHGIRNPQVEEKAN